MVRNQKAVSVAVIVCDTAPNTFVNGFVFDFMDKIRGKCHLLDNSLRLSSVLSPNIHAEQIDLSGRPSLLVVLSEGELPLSVDIGVELALQTVAGKHSLLLFSSRVAEAGASKKNQYVYSMLEQYAALGLLCARKYTDISDAVDRFSERLRYVDASLVTHPLLTALHSKPDAVEDLPEVTVADSNIRSEDSQVPSLQKKSGPVPQPPLQQLPLQPLLISA